MTRSVHLLVNCAAQQTETVAATAMNTMWWQSLTTFCVQHLSHHKIWGPFQWRCWQFMWRCAANDSWGVVSVSCYWHFKWSQCLHLQGHAAWLWRCSHCDHSKQPAVLAQSHSTTFQHTSPFCHTKVRHSDLANSKTDFKTRYVEIKCQLDGTDVFYCRSYCLLNMFQALLCPSSGAREYYTDVCCLWYLVLWFLSCRYGVELRVVCLVCGLQYSRAPDDGHNSAWNMLSKQ